ncbi:MAG: hypothetical protein QXL97_00190 [Candidatus Aenigmatarchaeota archaeon]
MGVTLYLYFSGYLGGLTGSAEREQEKIFECSGARLDVDYYKISDNGLNVTFINIGSVDLGGNFSIKVEFTNGMAVSDKQTWSKSLAPGEMAWKNISGISGTVKRVIVQPLDKCQIPFQRVKEI